MDLIPLLVLTAFGIGITCFLTIVFIWEYYNDR